jgi:hypothetical protein
VLYSRSQCGPAGILVDRVGMQVRSGVAWEWPQDRRAGQNWEVCNTPESGGLRTHRFGLTLRELFFLHRNASAVLRERPQLSGGSWIWQRFWPSLR